MLESFALKCCRGKRAQSGANLPQVEGLPVMGEGNWFEQRKRRARAFCIQRNLLAGTAALFVGPMQNENAGSLLHT